ncbi:MAG: hypothetical protein HLUCCX14_15375 [Marinobacter excellens HL-55]|uniref:Uncharacterized protein n=1 Tax=Marinobacter excellens HL-55 TaxID=1305731 RepID=A0A0P7Z5Q2_9GAMM|nr:MAG: hypothetical protein HLUCCX14_15375 [Marinobacter excellens HL-55]
MSLISKPFDDSGVDMVDDIARYGTLISKRIEQFRQRNHLRGSTGNTLSGLEVTLALCETLSRIIDTSSHEPYRTECARAVDTIFLESVSVDSLSGPEPTFKVRQSQDLMQEISSILADDQALPGDGSVPLQTVLLALVWSALIFATESLPADQARAWVRQYIMHSAAPVLYH